MYTILKISDFKNFRCGTYIVVSVQLWSNGCSFEKNIQQEIWKIHQKKTKSNKISILVKVNVLVPILRYNSSEVMSPVGDRKSTLLATNFLTILGDPQETFWYQINCFRVERVSVYFSSLLHASKKNFAIFYTFFSEDLFFLIYLKKLATNIAWQHSVPSYVASRQKMVEK